MQEITKHTLLAIDENGKYYKVRTSDGILGAITELTPEEYAEIQRFWEQRKSVMEFVSVALEDPARRIQYDENLRPYYVVDGERVYVDGKYPTTMPCDCCGNFRFNCYDHSY